MKALSVKKYFGHDASKFAKAEPGTQYAAIDTKIIYEYDFNGEPQEMIGSGQTAAQVAAAIDAIINAGIPATPTSPGTEGQIAADATNFYRCIAASTWKRVAWDVWV